jgi:hypothetical protein
MDSHQARIAKIFKAQDANGFWKLLPASDPRREQYLHYIPNFRASLWTLVYLADLGHDPHEPRVQKPLKALQEYFFDKKHGIYSLKEDHFPIPCLNGNMIYIDSYFNGKPGEKSQHALRFFYNYQRFDDGEYIGEKNAFCSNKSCFGKHSCYWGIVKLLKGISFIPKQQRSKETKELLQRCIDFVLLHKVCFSSRKEDRIMIKGLDQLSFPNMYKADFLELLWILKREEVQGPELTPALELLKSKQQADGSWLLEKGIRNLITGVGAVGNSNSYITNRAKEVLDYYEPAFS